MTTAMRTIKNVKTTANRTGARYGASFVLSVLWFVMLLIRAVLKLKTGGDTDTIEGAGEYVLIVWSIVILGYEICKLHFRRIKKSHRQFELLIIFAICVIIGYLTIRSGLTKLLILTSFILSFFVFKEYPLRRRELNVLYYVFIAVTLFIVVHGSTVGRRNDSTFWINSNECAVTLMTLFSLSIVRSAYTRKKLSSLCIAAVCFGLQFLFTSRGALIGCMIFAVLFFLLKRKRKTMRSRTAFWLLFIAGVAGVLFVFAYIKLYEIVGRGQIVIFGKDIFSGRQVIWEYTLESIRQHFWFGTGGHINEEIAAETGKIVFINAHNQALGILASFGIFTFLLFFLLLSSVLSSSGAVRANGRRRIFTAPILFMLAISVMNFTEMLYLFRWSAPLVTAAYAMICGYCLNGCAVKKEVRTGVRHG